MANKRECKQCGIFTREFIKIPAGVFCSLQHAIDWAKDKQEQQRQRKLTKLRQSQAKEDKVAKKAARELKRNDRKHQFQLTKSKIQQWVNHVRDAGLACISCGTEKPNIQYCGSHYKSAGGHPELALDTRNVHRGCNRYCNKALSGNISGNKTTKGYTAGLIERYGQDYVDWLDSYHEPKNYTCEDLIKIRAYYSKLIRENNNDDSNRPI